MSNFNDATGEEVSFLVDSTNIIDERDAADIDADLFGLETAEPGSPTGPFKIADDASLARAKDALTPGNPIFLVQRSHQLSAVIPDVMRGIRSASGLNTGVVAPIPRMKQVQIEKFFSSIDCPVKIADPECFGRDDSYGLTLAEQRGGRLHAGVSTSSKWEYYSTAIPSGGDEAWVNQVLDVQRGLGATALLTPGMWLDTVDPKSSITNLRQHVLWAKRGISDKENLAVNVTAGAAWLSSSQLRERLLAELLDLDQEVIYARFRWPLLVHPYGQLVSAEILDGYMELCNICEENDKFLILPNSGLTGWISLAWGASGFSTGIGAGERSFADTKEIKIKISGPRPAPTRRIFSRDLLHVIDEPTERNLVGMPRYAQCSCHFCKPLRSGNWDKALAGAHYLNSVAGLMADAISNPRGVRASMRSCVKEARDFSVAVNSLMPLSGANDPKHLTAWADRLR